MKSASGSSRIALPRSVSNLSSLIESFAISDLASRCLPPARSRVIVAGERLLPNKRLELTPPVVVEFHL